MKEVNESAIADVEQLKGVILDKMRSIVTNEAGEVAPAFVGAFDGYQADDIGNPVLQTLAGMIMMEAEHIVNGQIHYSPNLGVDAESLAAEVNDLSTTVAGLGYSLLIATAHYVDANGQVSYGQEARGIKQHVETSAILQRIKAMQDDMDSKPRLVLPDTKIITR